MLREAPLEINSKRALDRKHVPHGGKAACFGSQLQKLSTLDVKYKRTYSDSSLRNKVTQSQMLKQTAAGIQRNDRWHAHFTVASEFFPLTPNPLWMERRREGERLTHSILDWFARWLRLLSSYWPSRQMVWECSPDAPQKLPPLVFPPLKTDSASLAAAA